MVEVWITPKNICYLFNVVENALLLLQKCFEHVLLTLFTCKQTSLKHDSWIDEIYLGSDYVWLTALNQSVIQWLIFSNTLDWFANNVPHSIFFYESISMSSESMLTTAIPSQNVVGQLTSWCEWVNLKCTIYL